ncbi:hypothetical protein F383_29377 [Gossypium arboreum]|uniref:Uncharacterized protein n=1 Tax=Gossypium arboreum TaxID=29729 RepID=A0A0B0MVS5_GOSAR|nr:hypothetical protein F383_29377 [Gossypium arboreum]
MNVLSCHISSFNKASLMSITYVPVHTRTYKITLPSLPCPFGTFIASSIIIPVKQSEYYKCHKHT